MRESFKTTKKYIWKGVFSFLFYFAALYTLKDGLLPIMAHSFPGTRTEHSEAHALLSIATAASNPDVEETTTADEADVADSGETAEEETE